VATTPKQEKAGELYKLASFDLPSDRYCSAKIEKGEQKFCSPLFPPTVAFRTQA
jgi:hypothetical protein